MKSFLFFLLSILFLPAFSQQTGCEAPRGHNGEFITYYPNGIVKQVAHYSNGILQGNSRTYYKNSQLEEEAEYEMGKKTKMLQAYYEDGKPKFEQNEQVTNQYYPNGQLSRRETVLGPGLEKEEKWRFDGTKESEVTTLKSQRQGPFVYYDLEGFAVVTGEYKNNYYHGIITHLHANGRLHFKLRYTDGRANPDSTFVSYHPNGRIKETGLTKGESPVGNWQYYDSTGTIREEGPKGYRPWDNTMSLETRDAGSRRGTWKTYVNGRLKAIKKYDYPNYYYHWTLRHIAVDANGYPTSEQYYYADSLLFTRSFAPGDTNRGTYTYHPHFLEVESRDIRQALGTSRGHFADGKYYCDTVTDANGQVLMKDGQGKYRGSYETVSFPHIPQKPYAIHQYEYRYCDAWKGVCPIGESYYRTVEDYTYTAIGHFSNGMKQGLWKEGNFTLEEPVVHEEIKQKKKRSKTEEPIEEKAPEKIPDHCTGHYVDGQREGEWTFYLDDMSAKGNFVHGKKEGEWTISYHGGEEEWQRNRNMGIIKVLFRNDQRNGLCTTYSPDNVVLSRDLYKNGQYVGVFSQDYGNGKPRMRSIVKADTVYARIYLSPLGDTLACNGQACASMAFPFEDQKADRRYEWNDYGDIISETRNQNGKRHGKSWRREMNERTGKMDTTYIEYFVNGISHGHYYSYLNGTITEGLYEMGKRTGHWLIAFHYNSDLGSHYDDKTGQMTAEYTNGEKYVSSMQYEKGTYAVQNGNGIFHTEKTAYSDHPDMACKFDYIYRNGRVYLERGYYKNGSLRHEIMKTPRGDSLITFRSLAGSECIYGGNGTISTYNKLNLLEEILTFSQGRIIKKERFNNGSKDKTYFFMYPGEPGTPVVHTSSTETKPGRYRVVLEADFAGIDPERCGRQPSRVSIHTPYTKSDVGLPAGSTLLTHTFKELTFDEISNEYDYFRISWAQGSTYYVMVLKSNEDDRYTR